MVPADGRLIESIDLKVREDMLTGESDDVSKKAEIIVTSINGIQLKIIPIEINEGLNEILYTHGYGATGLLYYSLVIDGKLIDTKAMVFAN